MENRVNYLELGRMHFMSDTTEICIIGKVIQGNLSYLSEFRVDNSLINRILNRIQAQNPEKEIGELLKTEALANGDRYFEMNFDGVKAIIELHELDSMNKCIQIRA